MKRNTVYIITILTILVLAIFISHVSRPSKGKADETVIMLDVNKKLSNAGYINRGSVNDIWYLTEDMGNGLPREYKLEVKTHNTITGKIEIQHVYKFVEQKR